MIPIEGLIHAIVYLIVAGLIFFLLNWLIDYVGVPEPFHKVAKVVLAVFAVILVIGALLSIIGMPLVRW